MNRNKATKHEVCRRCTEMGWERGCTKDRGIRACARSTKSRREVRVESKKFFAGQQQENEQDRVNSKGKSTGNKKFRRKKTKYFLQIKDEQEQGDELGCVHQATKHEVCRRCTEMGWERGCAPGVSSRGRRGGEGRGIRACARCTMTRRRWCARCVDERG
ncbi:hypothetical protein PMAC_003427, partial [Pneumocystis sp. 'macacae']